MIMKKDNMVQELFKIIKNDYKAKEISLSKVSKYFLEYGDKPTISEISEGYISANEDFKIFIKDANTENSFLPDELRKYDMYIISYKNGKLLSVFYREEFGENKELVNLIESFKR